MEALVPELEPAPQPTSATCASPSHGSGTRRTRACAVAAAALAVPHAERIDPARRGNPKVFMREIAEVHATLFDEQPEAYGADVARKIGECRGHGRGGRRRDSVRASYRDEAAALLEGFDPPQTPTRARGTDVRGGGGRPLRAGITSFTNPFNVLGWFTALPCALPSTACPPGPAVGHPAAFVPGAGAVFEASSRRRCRNRR
jgi:hypothetical protein